MSTDRKSTSLGSPFQCFTILMVKEHFLISSLSLPWCSIVPLHHDQGTELRTSLCTLPTQGVAEGKSSLLGCFFSRLDSPGLCSQSILTARAFLPITSFVALLWMLTKALTSFAFWHTDRCLLHSNTISQHNKLASSAVSCLLPLCALDLNTTGKHVWKSKACLISMNAIYILRIPPAHTHRVVTGKAASNFQNCYFLLAREYALQECMNRRAKLKKKKRGK